MLVVVCTLANVGPSATTLHAQDIRITLVNGKNGRPMANKCIDVGIGDRPNAKSGSSIQIQTDKDGVASLRVTTDESKINAHSQRLACGLWGVINPVVKYGDTIGVRTGYVLCRPHTPDYSWLSIQIFSTKEVLQSGVVTPNACGKAKASSSPGEIIIFVRPLNWWEKLKT